MPHPFRATALRAAAFAATLCYAPPCLAQNPAVTVQVDAGKNRHAINPGIYGVSTGDWLTIPDLNIVLSRYGGNNASRYNWKLNCDNRGSDWFFESAPDPGATPGERGDLIYAISSGTHTDLMLTIPMLDWVGKVGPNREKLYSFSQAKYGAQTGWDPWMPDAGNSVRPDQTFVQNNDPNDANAPSSTGFQKEWVQHLVGKWGTAGHGGVRYYVMDNEPSLWMNTHRDVHPVGAGMDEIVDRTIRYAAMVKSVDPGAQVCAPEEWGWRGYFYSGMDLQWALWTNWQTLPDQKAHNGAYYLPFYLSQLHDYETRTGQRLLDVFTLHFYPQGGEYSDDVSPARQLMRNRSTRSLWDPNYYSESWIYWPVNLIHLMRDWVATYYPGTKTAITEYNWGAAGHINGATTQADVLGIFGREGLDMANYWYAPNAATPLYKAFKMYRNYDGKKSTFGDTSVSDSVPNPDNLSSFASVRSTDGAMTVMVINKVLSGSTPVTVNLANFQAGSSAQAWQLTSANAITRLADVPVAGSSLTATVPAQSITLFVIPTGAPSPPPNQAPIAKAAGTPTTGTAPLTVRFSSAGSSDPDGTIASYSWAFGDGVTVSGPSPVHTFAAPGSYTTTLTVTDNQGAAKTATLPVTVQPAYSAPPPFGLAASASGRTVTVRWTLGAAWSLYVAVERAPAGSTNFQQVGFCASSQRAFQQAVAPGAYVYRARTYNTMSRAYSAYTGNTSVTVR